MMTRREGEGSKMRRVRGVRVKGERSESEG